MLFCSNKRCIEQMDSLTLIIHLKHVPILLGHNELDYYDTYLHAQEENI